MGQIVLLAVALIFFTRHIFQYEKVSRFEVVTLPAYALIVGGLSIIHRPPALLPLLITLIGGALIGWFQTTGLSFHLSEKQDQFHRPIVLVRRNWQYLLGWVIIFAYGIGFLLWSGEQVNVLTELGNELLKELFAFENFSQSATWNIMLQTAVSSIVYFQIAKRKEPQLGAAIAYKRNGMK